MATATKVPASMSKPSDLYEHAGGPAMADYEQEHFRILLMDTKNRPIGEAFDLYIGTANACTVRVAEIFREAVRRNAVGLAVLHNHPSGDTEPSPEDLRLTRDVIAAGQLLDIVVLDHLVVGRESVSRPFQSLRERDPYWGTKGPGR